jgi:hypothetical protein
VLETPSFVRELDGLQIGHQVITQELAQTTPLNFNPLL